MKKLILALFFLVACGTTSVPNPTPSPTGAVASCQVTDQDNYVYNPDRLSVQAQCLKVSGEVLAKVQEEDGDFHIRVLLDPQYQNLLTPANQNQCANNDQGVRTCGLLVVEPVCVNPVSQQDAISTCASDPDPLTNLPNVGQHVWMEGRYVFDMDHGGWAELHPLFKWEIQ